MCLDSLQTDAVETSRRRLAMDPDEVDHIDTTLHSLGVSRVLLFLPSVVNGG